MVLISTSSKCKCSCHSDLTVTLQTPWPHGQPISYRDVSLTMHCSTRPGICGNTFISIILLSTLANTIWMAATRIDYHSWHEKVSIFNQKYIYIQFSIACSSLVGVTSLFLRLLEWLLAFVPHIRYSPKNFMKGWMISLGKVEIWWDSPKLIIRVQVARPERQAHRSRWWSMMGLGIRAF